jgi:antirestriction protein ArdC
MTLFHELVHSTGHESRLNRKSLVEHDGFGGKVYSEEELVAEIGAAFLATEADIVHDEHEQSAAYLRSWIEMLGQKDHRRWIVRAANQAAKAADFILNRTPAVEPVLEPAAE